MKRGRNKSIRLIFSSQYSEGSREPAKQIIWFGGQSTSWLADRFALRGLPSVPLQ